MEQYKITPDQYQQLLKEIKYLPKELNVIGNIPDKDHKFLCIVGARKYSPYGKEVCKRLISGLKGYPITIVSGLAIGIDSISHECAIEFGINTIAFPGSGLSRYALYPAQHYQLAQKIIENGGCLISPFKDNQVGTTWTFPFRNRLMAGISHATLIIEARKGSGTLLTAEYATEFNRDVLAVPGSIFSELSYGPHMLIKSGATPITSANDVLEALGFEAIKDTSQKSLLDIIDKNLSENEKSIIDYLKISNLSGTDLIEKTGLSPTIFNTTISELELKGLLIESGGLYKIKSPNF